MISRAPRIGDTIESMPLWGTHWQLWGVVSAVEADTVRCVGRASFTWRFGNMGHNTAFRISQEAPIVPAGQLPDHRPGDYFVDAHDTQSGKTWLILGPFARHQSALNLIEPVRKWAESNDPRAHFLAWGTLRKEPGSGSTGSANKLFGASVDNSF